MRTLPDVGLPVPGSDNPTVEHFGTGADHVQFRMVFSRAPVHDGSHFGRGYLSFSWCGREMSRDREFEGIERNETTTFSRVHALFARLIARGSAI